jgi:hypothetical protein
MPKIRRPLVALALLLVLSVSLSGCVHLQRGVKLNSDGSGTFSFLLGFSDKLTAFAGSSFAAEMNACGEKVKAGGGSFTSSDTNGYSSWTFTWPFNSLQRLNELSQMNTSFCTIPNTNVPTSATADDTFAVTAHAHFLTTTYVLTGHLSFQLQSSGTTTQDPSTAALLREAYSSFSITMPTWVSSESAGGAVNGATVTYTAHPGDTLDFQVVGEGLNTPALLALGGGALLGLGLLALLVRLFRRSEAAEREHAAAEIPVA